MAEKRQQPNALFTIIVSKTRACLRGGSLAAMLCFNAAVYFAGAHYLFRLSSQTAAVVAFAITTLTIVIWAKSFMYYIRGDGGDFNFTFNPDKFFNPKVAFWLMALIVIPALASVIRLGLFLLAIPVDFGLGLLGMNMRSLVEPYAWIASTLSIIIALLAWWALWRRFKRDLAANPT